MDKELLTIAEVAREANKSYQNIYQRTKTTLKDYVVKKDGKTYLKSDVLYLFNIGVKKETFEDGFKADLNSNLNTGIEDNLKDESIPLHKDVESELRETITQLRSELKAKDEQLKQQTEEILKLTNRVVELFENSQKLQLQTSFLLGNNVDVNDEGAPPYDDAIEEKPKPKRKGFLNRFFK